MTDYQKSTARERKDAERKSWIYRFAVIFSQTRKAHRKAVHAAKQSQIGGASGFYKYRAKKKAKNRRRRKLAKAQRQG